MAIWWLQFKPQFTDNITHQAEVKFLRSDEEIEYPIIPFPAIIATTAESILYKVDD